MFALQSAFLTKLLILGILFSNAFNAAFLAKPLVLGIFYFYFSNSCIIVCFFNKYSSIMNFFLNSDFSVSYLGFRTNALASILFTLATNLSHTAFLATSFFTTLLSLLKSTGTGTNFSLQNLYISAFKLAKSDLEASLDLPIYVAFLKSAFAA